MEPDFLEDPVPGLAEEWGKGGARVLEEVQDHQGNAIVLLAARFVFIRRKSLVNRWVVQNVALQ
jgi:hypothetical protein